MSQQIPFEYDVVGVGFGPSNLALAIALDEYAKKARAGLRSIFVEKQPQFTWHGGMLLPGSDMQISFLKDLVSMRDPTSPFTFVNYLHKCGRLLDFSNCRTFQPSRIEFNDYLRWVAGQFRSVATYGEEIIAVEPVTAGHVVNALRVLSRKAAGEEGVRMTRNLVVAAGGTAHIPALFAAVTGDPRVLHTSSYLAAISVVRPESNARIAVIGGGQSAAEVTLDLSGRFPGAGVDLIFRGHALKPSDSSPFVNEIFNPDFTDTFFAQDAPGRQALIGNFRNTNYAVIDPDLLDELYRRLYQQKVTGRREIELHPRSEIVSAHARADGIAVEIINKDDGNRRSERFDVLVLATGYERSAAHAFLQPLRPYIESDVPDRHYRLSTAPGFRPQIHLQGYSEMSHGLSDTLLSVLPMRAQEIAMSLASTMSGREMIA